MRSERRIILVAAALLSAAILRQPASSPATPPLVPAAEAAPWMADCLPGVGPKRLPAALADLRRGTWERLPRQAQPAAWFSRPADAGPGTP